MHHSGRCSIVWKPDTTPTDNNSNAVELIVAIIALVDKEVLIVQTSLIGSMLSNLLLVMGMCFFSAVSTVLSNTSTQLSRRQRLVFWR